MPLYEYVCTKCHHKFEKIQKFSDPKVRKCPECGGKVEQTIHAPAVQFKGTGWYVTDYGRKSHSKEGHAKEGGAEKKKEESKTAKEPADGKAKKPESKKHKD